MVSISAQGWLTSPDPGELSAVPLDTEQFGLGGRELGVGQGALPVHRGELVERGWPGGCLGGHALLLKRAEPRVLVGFLFGRGLCLLAAAGGGGPRRAVRSASAIHLIRKFEAERDHDLRRGGEHPRQADLRRDRRQHADDVPRRYAGVQGGRYLPQVRT